MLVLVVYDVSDNAKRLKLAKELKRLGLSRIQRSAFQGEVDPQRLKEIVRRARDIVDPKTDIVHVVPLNVREWEARVVIGKEGVVEELIV